jgi:uncharacterized protein YgbK (DUF1537 family)
MTKTTQEKIAKAQAELRELGEEAQEVASDETTSTALVAVGSSADAAKKQMALARASAVKMQEKIRKKQEELETLLNRQMAEAERQMKEALQVLAAASGAGENARRGNLDSEPLSRARGRASPAT